MSAYRDEYEALRTRTERLERELEERDARIAGLEERLGDNDALVERLRGVIDDRTAKPTRRWATFGAGIAATLGVVGVVGAAVTLLGARKADAAPHVERVAPAVTLPALPPAPDGLPSSQAGEAAPLPPIPPGNLCARLGIRITVDGSDAEALATGDRDGSGTKFRRNGDRAVYFGVAGFNGAGKSADATDGKTGNLYIHGWGSDMPANVGTSKMTLFDIMTKGESGGYTLARDGRSVLEVMGNDGKNAWGRFEADMSRVADVTRPPAFGTPVVRVRGNFCLPFHPGDPHDTGP